MTTGIWTEFSLPAQDLLTGRQRQTRFRREVSMRVKHLVSEPDYQVEILVLPLPTGGPGAVLCLSFLSYKVGMMGKVPVSQERCDD